MLTLSILDHYILRETSPAHGHLWKGEGHHKIAKHAIEPIYDILTVNLDIDELARRALIDLQARGLVMHKRGEQGEIWWNPTDLGEKVYATSWPSNEARSLRNRLRYAVYWLRTDRYAGQPLSFLEWSWANMVEFTRKLVVRNRRGNRGKKQGERIGKVA